VAVANFATLNISEAKANPIHPYCLCTNSNARYGQMRDMVMSTS